MNMKKSVKLRFLSFFAAIFFSVLIVIVIFFALVRNEIIKLSMERVTLVAENCTNDISRWATGILDELNIYQAVVEKEGGVMDDHTMEMVSTSLNAHSEYPYGIYWADRDNHFYIASGWHEDNFVPTERSWYSEGLGHTRFEFGEPYVDVITGKSCVSATSRVITNGVEGVMASDVYLDYASDVVKQISAQEIEKAFVVTKKSRIIVADSDAAMNLQVLNETAAPLYQHINALLDRHYLGQTTVDTGQEYYYVNINRIENTDWLLVTCMNQKVLTEKLRQPELAMVFIGLAVCATLVLLALLISRKVRANDQKAKTDPLTGLFNRSGLKDAGVQLLENTPGQGALIIMDMDNFKQINDQLGHPEGDVVLKSFAGLLAEFFNRNRDFVARLGGDEFAVFVGRKIDKETFALMLNKFMRQFHEKFDIAYSTQQLSVSIGVAFAVDCFSNYDELYRHADAALYNAKQEGKDRYAFDK